MVSLFGAPGREQNPSVNRERGKPAPLLGAEYGTNLFVEQDESLGVLRSGRRERLLTSLAKNPRYLNLVGILFYAGPVWCVLCSSRLPRLWLRRILFRGLGPRERRSRGRRGCRWSIGLRGFPLDGNAGVGPRCFRYCPAGRRRIRGFRRQITRCLPGMILSENRFPLFGIMP